MRSDQTERLTRPGPGTLGRMNWKFKHKSWRKRRTLGVTELLCFFFPRKLGGEREPDDFFGGDSFNFVEAWILVFIL